MLFWGFLYLVFKCSFGDFYILLLNCISCGPTENGFYDCSDMVLSPRNYRGNLLGCVYNIFCRISLGISVH